MVKMFNKHKTSLKFMHNYVEAIIDDLLNFFFYILLYSLIYIFKTIFKNDNDSIKF